MQLKRLVASTLVAGSLLAASSGAVGAAQPREPIPNTPNCHGTFISMVSSNGELNPAQASKAFGVPVKDLQEFVRALCAGENPPFPGQ